MNDLLRIDNVTVSIDGKVILKDFSLSVPPGEIHALMGRNGSGKTTICNILMGHPDYVVESGAVYFKGENIRDLPTFDRARRGIFVAFQYPLAIPGVTVYSFLQEAVKAVRGAAYAKTNFRKKVTAVMEALDIDARFLTRTLNDGFSGGEKKRMEVLQLVLLEPALIVLDEIDSGLDVDTLQVLTRAVLAQRAPDRSIILISHYQKIIDAFAPDHVHVLHKGRIAKSGAREISARISAMGFEKFYTQIVESGEGARP